MKFAIQTRDRGFSGGWIEACNAMGIDIVRVDAYSPDVVQDILKCDAFMWHWSHTSTKDWLFARQLIASVELAGVKVFPDINTCWHFDDKVGQKYLFEAMGVPAVRSYVFYDSKQAFDWAETAEFPKVFKLRGGAGSANVRLIHSNAEARKIIRKMFGRGMPAASEFADFSNKFRKHRGKGDLWVKIRGSLHRMLLALLGYNVLPRQRGYVYFQDFVPHNKYDIRVIVIGNRAFAMRRYCRPNDFRASGSGDFSYARLDIPEECLRIAFEVAKKLYLQCGAFDFVQDVDGHHKIVEVSYGFMPEGYTGKCEGHWTSDLVWHDEPIALERWMVELVLESCSSQKH